MQPINEYIPETWYHYVKDLLATLYLVCGKTEILLVDRGMMYNVDTRMMGVPVNELHHYAGSGDIQFDKDDLVTAEKPTAIANYLSDPTLCIVPLFPEHDVFTDLLYKCYLGITKDDYPAAFVSMQCFFLMSKIASERQPMVGGAPQSIEVIPYGI